MVKDSPHRRDVCEFRYLVGKVKISRSWTREVLPVQLGSVLARGGIGSWSALEWALESAVCSGWVEDHVLIVAVECLQILCGAIWTRRASRCVGVTKHSQMSFYRSLHLFMLRKLNTPCLLFLDRSARFLDQILSFLYYSARKPSIGHFGHVQSQAHIWLFQLYMTFLPCHRSRHVDCLQEISCCF